jgi:CheY-like chemotaxis protein
MLGNWGLHTIEAESGAQALAALNRAASAGEPVSLILTDLNMPEMSGFDFTQTVRERGAFSNLPILLLTSSSTPGDQARCDELRIAARLLKPVKQSLLLDNLLRVLQGANRIDRAAAPGQPADDAEGVIHQKLKILLAEDNPVNQKFAMRLLENAGHTVTVASDGRRAVTLWGAEPFDLILMDVQMPELDGLDATREIRANEAASGKHIPIIAMTANAMAGDRELCIDAGMDGYVAKPVKKASLFSEMSRVLSARTEGESHAAGI